MNTNIIQTLIIYALPVLFGITVHEVAHGWVASKCGDQTAKIMGRLTLNPIKHIDLIGTILVPIVLAMFSPIVFGWAKPVPVSSRNFKHPKRDMALVSIAGPAANLFMALIWAAIAKFGMILVAHGFHFFVPLALMGIAGIQINLWLMIFNLFPIPPLDGGHFVSSLLPGRMAYHYDKLERYGFFILLILIFTRVIFYLIALPYGFLYRLIAMIFRLPM